MPGEAAVAHAFQAEVSEVLHLVIHSLYSHKEIFLRELVSNASDALDKLRFRAITEPDLLKDDAALEVRIIPDREAGTLTVADTGVGMSKAELEKDLGTIARSGSRAFLEQLKKQGQGKDLSLIGQFGVGFYSAFLVADRVSVISRAAGSSEAFVWSSDGKQSFTVEPAPESPRGTQVVLHLKEDQKEFLDDWRLKDLIARYSDYVSHPIKLVVKDKEPERINRASALWQRSRQEITEEQYQEFFKHLTHSIEPAVAHAHFRFEGTQEFTGLLFLPKSRPFDLDFGKRRGVQLFVKRIFIMEDCEDILPQWLRFIRGVVDSDDLPLNVSRELLQDSQVVRTMRKQVTKKSLELMADVATNRPADYAEVWSSFGVILKEGLALDPEHKDKLAELLRYPSSRGEGLVSLAEYHARMPLAQPAIYYVIGETLKAVEGSPHTEALRARGYEVLFMTDAVDEWATEGLREYQGKPLVSAMRADLELEETEVEKATREERSSAMKPLLEKIQEVLKERVRDVRITTRLTDSPCCLVAAGHEPHPYVERLLRERGQAVPKSKRILEINAGHPLLNDLAGLLARDPKASRIPEFIEVLYAQALLTEGSFLEDPNAFAKQITDLLSLAARAAS